jgi:hypothetical protein
LAISFLSRGRSAVAPLDLLAEDRGRPGSLERSRLVDEVLGVGRDAGIEVDHALIVHQKSASKKGNHISDLILMQII